MFELFDAVVVVVKSGVDNRFWVRYIDDLPWFFTTRSFNCFKNCELSNRVIVYVRVI